LPGIKKIKSGKVREMFDLGDRLLLVASDRISAFDVIMPNGIPARVKCSRRFRISGSNGLRRSFQSSAGESERSVAKKFAALCR